VGNKTFDLNLDLEDIEELYDVGELSFDDIYEYVS
jgi:hypothetical protein